MPWPSDPVASVDDQPTATTVAASASAAAVAAIASLDLGLDADSCLGLDADSCLDLDVDVRSRTRDVDTGCFRSGTGSPCSPSPR